MDISLKKNVVDCTRVDKYHKICKHMLIGSLLTFDRGNIRDLG